MAPQTLQSRHEHKLPVVDDDTDQRTERVQRAQWLRAAILGANDGLLSTTSLMLGIGAIRHDRWSMVLSGLAGALAGACSMAVGEFVSVSMQRDIEEATANTMKGEENNIIGKETLPSPYKAAAASALAFLCGSFVPIASAMFAAHNTVRTVVIVVVASLALALFGGVGAQLGGAPIRVSAVRVLVGGWVAMAITYGLLKPFEKEE
ncbi:vacuolar iron transporter homolog 1-like [Vitis vinifera]|uniref:vacuolar iron transporter homolog 1-like n=1 Tax=Vitis vinifera TaxID=29760 RepID=UPI0008FF7B42|nr:vacuolar iron transporter homolog 1-like [Vitis vinifera]|eukprot:XP_019074870.1 PREDICTED: vacuolar iron transporter homolog 1-like [Vitis vinifera]